MVRSMAFFFAFIEPLHLFFIFFCSLAVDENESHATATYTTSITNQVKQVKYPKNTFGRPQILRSQKVVIGSDELIGQNIEKVVRQKINSLDKSPKIVRSTALIIKSSRTPMKPYQLSAVNNIKSTVSRTETLYATEPVDIRFATVNSDNGLLVVSQKTQVSPSKILPTIPMAKISYGAVIKHGDHSDISVKPANGNVMTGRAINRPIAFAMAVAAAAVATVYGGSNCKDFHGITSGHDSSGESLTINLLVEIGHRRVIYH